MNPTPTEPNQSSDLQFWLAYARAKAAVDGFFAWAGAVTTEKRA